MQSTPLLIHVTWGSCDSLSHFPLLRLIQVMSVPTANENFKSLKLLSLLLSLLLLVCVCVCVWYSVCACVDGACVCMWVYACAWMVWTGTLPHSCWNLSYLYVGSGNPAQVTRSHDEYRLGSSHLTF